MTNIEHSISELLGNRENGERTTPVCNGSRMTAGGLPVNARSRGRLGVRLGLLYSRKATALAISA